MRLLRISPFLSGGAARAPFDSGSLSFTEVWEVWLMGGRYSRGGRRDRGHHDEEVIALRAAKRLRGGEVASRRAPESVLRAIWKPGSGLISGRRHKKAVPQVGPGARTKNDDRASLLHDGRPILRRREFPRMLLVSVEGGESNGIIFRIVCRNHCPYLVLVDVTTWTAAHEGASVASPRRPALTEDSSCSGCKESAHGRAAVLPEV